MPNSFKFESKETFRDWLTDNCKTAEGVWLIFGKNSTVRTLSTNDALEEALCFGWIDGQMKSIDDSTYIKYFSQRRKNSKWSEKNKKLVSMLEQQGRMTDFGRTKIEEAKQNGSWDAPKAPPITDEQVAELESLLKGIVPAYANFIKKPPSVRRAFAGFYYEAKAEDTRARRLTRIIDRLNRDLNLM